MAVHLPHTTQGGGTRGHEAVHVRILNWLTLIHMLFFFWLPFVAYAIFRVFTRQHLRAEAEKFLYFNVCVASEVTGHSITT